MPARNPSPNRSEPEPEPDSAPITPRPHGPSMVRQWASMGVNASTLNRDGSMLRQWSYTSGSMSGFRFQSSFFFLLFIYNIFLKKFRFFLIFYLINQKIIFFKIFVIVVYFVPSFFFCFGGKYRFFIFKMFFFNIFFGYFSRFLNI